MRSRINHGGTERGQPRKNLFQSLLIVRIYRFLKISKHQVSDIRHLLRNLSLNILEPENLTYMSIKDTILKEIHKIRNILNSSSFILVKPDKENRSIDSIDVNFHVRSI